MNLSDIIRIPNSDISDVMCLSDGNTVYVRESAVAKVAAENNIQDINGLCSFIIEQNGYDPEDYRCMIVKDVRSPMMMENSYLVSSDDPILDIFGFVEAYVDLIPYLEAEYVEMKPSEEYTKIMNQRIGLFYEKVDAVVRRVDYDEPEEIKRRITKCDDAIKRLKTEYDHVHNREKDKTGDKRDLHQYNAVVIVKAITNLATDLISVKINNILSGVFKNTLAPFIRQTGRQLSVDIRKVKGQKAADNYVRLIDKSANRIGNAIEHKNTGKVMRGSILRNLNQAINKMIPAPDYERALINYIGQIKKTKAFLEKEYAKSVEKQQKKAEKKQLKSSKNESSFSTGPSLQEIMHETGSYQSN